MSKETGNRRILITATLSVICLVAGAALVRHALEADWWDALVAAGAVVLLLPTHSTVDWMAADVRERSLGPSRWQQLMGLSFIGTGLAAGLMLQWL
ncbi:MAG: hypothetical protein WEB57_13745 [Pseudohongiellaceae bacterium]